MHLNFINLISPVAEPSAHAQWVGRSWDVWILLTPVPQSVTVLAAVSVGSACVTESVPNLNLYSKVLTASSTR